MPRHSLRPLLLCALCLFSCSDTPEIRLGGSSGGSPGRPISPGDPSALYNDAYNGLTKPNVILREELKQSNCNRVALREAMHQITENLRTMERLVAPPFSDKLNGYIQQYEEMEKEVSAGSLSPGSRGRIERLERNVRIEFSPSRNLPLQVTPPEVEQGPVVTTAGKRGPKGSAPAGDAAAPAVPGSNPNPGPPPPAPDGGGGEVPYWVLFNAWKQSHDDLAAAYSARKGDYDPRYKKVRETLGLIRAALPESDRAKIDLYLKEYQRIHDATEGFLKIPEGQTEAQVRAQLDGVGRAIELTYHPDEVGVKKPVEPK